MSAPVNTKKAPVRSLAFKSLGEIVSELDRLQAAHDAGTLQVTGNWTAGQICDHCTRLVDVAMDGTDVRLPFVFRFLGKNVFKGRILKGKPLPRGLKIPPKIGHVFLPSDTITDTDGITKLKASLQRAIQSSNMTQPSPLFGPLTHEEWTTIQLAHCSMHLGFTTY